MRRAQWPPPVYVNRGKEIIRIRVGPGRYKNFTLGLAGSEEAKAEYARRLSETGQADKQPDRTGQENRTVPPLPRRRGSLPIVRLVQAYLEHRQGTVCTKQYARVGRALRALTDKFGKRAAASFDSIALEEVQQAYAGLVTRYANQLTGIVRQCFRWGASKRLVPLSVVESLRTLAPIRRGKESRKVRPANLADVEATLRHMQPITADLVRLIRFSGMRAGEACIIRPCDVNRDGVDPDGIRHPGLWVYVPESHKNQHRGLERVIFLGPQAQAVLAPYLLRESEAFCFSPREAVERFQSSRQQTFNAGAKRVPSDRYNSASLGCAVRRAIKRAKAGHWHVHQLRHGCASTVRAQCGLEHARAALGHHDLSVTAIYAETDRQKAAEAMRLVG